MTMLMVVERTNAAAAAALTLESATTRIIPRRYSGARSQRRAEQYAKEAREYFPGMDLAEISTDHLTDFATSREQAGNAPATVNLKLSFFSSLFEEFARDLRDPADPNRPFNPPRIPWRRRTKLVKWWLKPDLEAKVLAWCIERGEHDLADFIAFITHTGCRVEEALRLQRDHFDLTAKTVTIPGTKTSDAQRTVPLFAEALAIAQHRFRHAGNDAFLFHFSPCDAHAVDVEVFVTRSCEVIKKKWRLVRIKFGLTRTSTATPKALRRTFARRANDNGMPTELLRQYLGHSDIGTTIEYLRLVGGYTDEMRKYVS